MEYPTYQENITLLLPPTETYNGREVPIVVLVTS